MRHSVTTLRYRTRRIIDRILSRVFPSSSVTHTPLQLAPATTTYVKTASSPAPGATVPLSSHLSRDYPGGWISLYTMVRETSLLPFLRACFLGFILFYFYISRSLLGVINAFFSFSFTSSYSLSGRSTACMPSPVRFLWHLSYPVKGLCQTRHDDPRSHPPLVLDEPRWEIVFPDLNMVDFVRSFQKRKVD